MIVFRISIVGLLIAGGICAGCANPMWVDSGNSHELDVVKLSEHDLHPDATNTAAVASGQGTGDRGQGAGDGGQGASAAATVGPAVAARAAAAPMATAPPSAQPPPEANASRELLALIAEVQSLGALDQAAQQQLMNDLKQSDPALWPQLVRQFRTALAYRQHAAEVAARQNAAGDDGNPAIVGKNIPPAQDDVAVVQPALALSNADTKPANANSGDDNANPPAVSVVVKPAPRPANKAAAAPRKPSVKPANHTAEMAAEQMADPASHETADQRPEKPRTKSAAKSAVNPAAAPPADESQLRLSSAILTLEGETADGATGPAELERQIRLRFLYLLSGRRDDAMRPISGMPPAEQEFWSKELFGLAAYLDSQRIADPQRRATEAALHLGEAVERLGELATPSVRNLAFCQKVDSFGVFKKFPDYDFKPGDEVLLYCEVENLKSESTDKGFHTSVKSSYQILDSRGSRVAEQEFPASEDYCTSPRRDFFIPYYIWIPKRINAGPYTLQLTVEDAQTNKVGQSSIQFNVK